MNENFKFSNALIVWYLKNKRDLPWRNTKNPYFVWLSEIILQQTKISQGMPYYLKFIEKFNHISLLANANEEQILKLWQGLGYYSRARNLHQSAIYIMNDLNGVFPNKYEDLLKLKGVGDYTASAIASICYNLPHATVDGNVYRVLSRYFGINSPINSSTGIKEFKQLAQSLMDKKNPGTHNQALMEFGALICKPKKPECLKCVLNSSCYALQNNQVKNLPIKLNKVILKKRYFNFIVLNINDDFTFIEQREKKDIWQNLFQFPLYESLKVIEYEEFKTSDLLQCLMKDESFTIRKYNQKPINHKLTHQLLHTTFWIIDTNTKVKNAILWQNLSNFAIPTLIQNFIDNFRKGK